MAGSDDCHWFHGKITRENAVNILSAHGKNEGVFLVRESKTVPGDFVLSLWHENQALHFQIQNRGGIFFSIDDGPVFQGLDSLVDYYRNDADGLPIRLTSYCQGGQPPSSIRKRGVQTSLHNACAEGNSSLVRKYLKENPSDVNARNEHGASPLHEASSRGLDGVVSMLLKAGADIRSRDNSGSTPLMNACTSGYASTCSILIQQGHADMQERCSENGWVPLHVAAARGHADCVQTLIELGAALHPRTADGDTPKDLALRYEHFHIAELIDNFPQAPPKTYPKHWLHENLDRKGAVAELTRWGAGDGLFLVRLSTREHGYYVLSLSLNKQIFHYQIRSRADRFFYIDDGPLFETLPHIIDHYSKSADGLPVLLKMAVPPTGHPPINISHRAAMPGGYPAHTGRPATPSTKSIPAGTTGGGGSPKQLPRTKSMEDLLNGQQAPSIQSPHRRVSSPVFNRSQSEIGPPKVGVDSEDYNQLEEWTGEHPPPPAKPPPRAFRRPPPPLPPQTPPREPLPAKVSSPATQAPPAVTPRAPVAAVPPPPAKTSQAPKTAQQTLIARTSLELGPELGQGEFGSVLKGVWKNSKGIKIPVALKTLHPEKIAHGEQEFLREARVMYGLDHPCIVQLIGVCLGPPLILVQELVAMGALLDYLIDHPSEITQQDFKLWAAQIAWGMTYLEKKRFVHRDLATRNILMANKSQLKISDFGLSRAVGAGSDYYRASQGGRWPVKWYAPESINYGTFSHKSDVWSYGVTLWEMYSFGQLPYGEMTGAEVIRLLEEEGKRLGRPEGCPEHTYSLMLQCWDLKPEKRPTFAELHHVFSTNPLYSDVKLLQRDKTEKT